MIGLKLQLQIGVLGENLYSPALLPNDDMGKRLQPFWMLKKNKTKQNKTKQKQKNVMGTCCMFFLKSGLIIDAVDSKIDSELK